MLRDLRADGVSTAEELERLLALGARRRDVDQESGVQQFQCPHHEDSTGNSGVRPHSAQEPS